MEDQLMALEQANAHNRVEFNNKLQEHQAEVQRLQSTTTEQLKDMAGLKDQISDLKDQANDERHQ